MNLFGNLFYKLLAEDMTAGAEGAFGQAVDRGGSIEARDTYAKDDARKATALGARKRKKKNKKNKFLTANTQMPIPIQRRSGMTGPSGKATIGSV